MTDTSSHQPAPGTKPRILVVEDSRDIAELLKMFLEPYGYEVDTTSGIVEAMELVKSGSYDLLLSDLRLPDGSGLDLIRDARRLKPIKGIAVSGYDSEAHVRESLAAGFAAHLVKPVEENELLDTIKKVLS